jgi:hypothetical protein
VQNFIKGVLGSFAIHLIFGLLAFGLVFLFTSEFGNASEEVVLQTQNASDPNLAVLDSLAYAREQLASWIWPAIGVSFLSAVLFLGLAQRTMPSTPSEARGRKGLWTGLMVGLVLFSAIWWWFAVASTDASFALLFGNYALILLTTFLLVILGYFLSTAFFVKSTMVPSVPLAPLLRGK